MYFMVIIFFFGPLSIMSLSYYNILKFTRESKQRVNRHRDIGILQEETQRKRGDNADVYEQNRKRLRKTQEEVKMTNTLMIIVACFMACWAPFAITMFFDVYYPHPLPRIVDISTLLLGYANSMCNPIVYGVRNQAVRSELVRLVTQCYCPCVNTNRVSVLKTNQVELDANSVKDFQINTAQAPAEMPQVSMVLIAESTSDETSSKPALRSTTTESTQIA